jgi:hypothetical protein
MKFAFLGYDTLLRAIDISTSTLLVFLQSSRQMDEIPLHAYLRELFGLKRLMLLG